MFSSVQHLQYGLIKHREIVVVVGTSLISLDDEKKKIAGQQISYDEADLPRIQIDRNYYYFSNRVYMFLRFKQTRENPQ